MVAFSDSISTGESGKATRGVDFDRIESALKRVPGVSQVTLNGRSIDIVFEGLWPDLKKLEFAVAATGVSAETLNPARIAFRPGMTLEDPSKALEALKGLSSVQHVTRENNDLIAYVDLMALGLDSVRSTCEGLGVRGQIVSHEEIKVAFSGSGEAAVLKEDLERTKWVLKAEIDTLVRVVAPKGRVTRALVKSVMAKNGFSPAK